MERGLGTLQLVEHLLIQLLASTQSGELNLHVLGTRQGNHPLCQVGNLHRLTHVKHEDLTAMTLGTSLQHQLTGLRYQHEETHDIRVCHSHRTTILDLLSKQRDDTTVRSQHITEACGHKLCLCRFVGLQRLVQALHIDLADTL